MVVAKKKSDKNKNSQIKIPDKTLEIDDKKAKVLLKVLAKKEKSEEDEESSENEEIEGIEFSNISRNQWVMGQNVSTSLDQRLAITSMQDFDLRGQNLEEDLHNFAVENENVLEKEKGFYEFNNSQYTGGQTFHRYKNSKEIEEIRRDSGKLREVVAETMTLKQSGEFQPYQTKTIEEIKEENSSSLKKYNPQKY